MNSERTFETIVEQDLQEILHFSEQELERFIEQAGKPMGKYRAYRDRLLAICLVQGVAQHFVDSHPEFDTDNEVKVEVAGVSKTA